MNQVQTLYTEDGGLYAAFVFGHVELTRTFTKAEQCDIAKAAGLTREDIFDGSPVQLFHIRRVDAKRRCDHWGACHADAPGAVAVTGILIG